MLLSLVLVAVGVVLLFLVLFFKIGDGSPPKRRKRKEKRRKGKGKKGKKISPPPATRKTGKGRRKRSLLTVILLLLVFLAVAVGGYFLFLAPGGGNGGILPPIPTSVGVEENGVVSSPPPSASAVRRPGNFLGLTLFVAFVVWALFGVSKVPQGYQLPVLFLGKHVHTFGRGVAWYPPIVGGKGPLVSIRDRVIPLPEIDDAETADSVVVVVRADVVVRVVDAGQYLYNLEGGDTAIRKVAHACIKGVVPAFPDEVIVLPETRRRVSAMAASAANKIFRERGWGVKVSFVVSDISRTDKLRRAREEERAALVRVRTEEAEGTAYSRRVLAQARADMTVARMVDSILGPGTYLALRRLEALKEAASSGNLVVWNATGGGGVTPAQAALLRKFFTKREEG